MSGQSPSNLFAESISPVGFASVVGLIALVTFVLLADASTALISSAIPSQQTPLSSPFDAFSDLLPGQYVESSLLLARGYACAYLPGSAGITERCTRSLEPGPVWAVSVVLSNHVVIQLELMLREGALALGDLMLRWGSPQIRVINGWVNLDWSALGVVGTTGSWRRGFSYFQSITHLVMRS